MQTMFLRYSLSVLLLLLHLCGIKGDCGCNNQRQNANHEGDRSSYFKELSQKQSAAENDCYSLKPQHNENMVKIPAGDYQFGTDDFYLEEDNEQPKRMLPVSEFYIDKYEVSNWNFQKFVDETNYESEAEKFGNSFVFHIFLNGSFKEKLEDFRAVEANWWYNVNGSDWKHPFGPDSNLDGLISHPVVHVSWNDAKAYCSWRGARLPTELEWEAACRAGHQDRLFPWGSDLYPGKKHMANIWQGTFPENNSAKDGYIGTSPVESFEQNEFGLHNIVGNVWEWTEDHWEGLDRDHRVKRGGSFLCHRSFCYRYRCSARSHNTHDTTASNLGFRCAKSA